MDEICKFLGHPVPMPLTGNVDASVQLYDFGYIDSDGVLWLTLRGDITDGRSGPRFLDGLIDHPYYNPRGMFLHDSAYAWQQGPRKACDRMMREVMEVTDYGGVKRKLFYFFVDRCGGKAYRDQDPEDVCRYDLIPHEILNQPSDLMIPPKYRELVAARRKELFDGFPAQHDLSLEA